jgi:geranylgeranyl diphosphate synthase type II
VASTDTAEQPELDHQRLHPPVDTALDRYTRLDEGCPTHLAEAIRYVLLGPGKRLRPILVLLAARACRGSTERAMPAACAVEMVHAYSLVHDDLPAMDDDDLRRGRPTCHKVYGEATAILAGDALLARAFEVLATDVQPPALAARCCAELAQAAGATALVGGQAADLASQSASGDIRQLEAIHCRKTGALFVAAVRLGGIVGGASNEGLAALEAYGRHLGLAFQITDDLLDVAGSQAAVGKRVAKDAALGKMTFPRLLGVEESRRRAARSIDEACAALEVLGPAAEPLRALARFVGRRES